MTHKKRFMNRSGQISPISGYNSNTGSWNGSGGQHNYPPDVQMSNYGSRLPEVYTGHPNRMERYFVYETMSCDPEIAAGLDILSEFSTQRNEYNDMPFEIKFSDEPTPHEVELLSKQLNQWVKLNEFDSRIFKIFRNTIKYGDQVFVRDPDNFKLYWVDMTKVLKVIVNEAEGKAPEQYIIKDLNVNLQNLSVAQKTSTDYYIQPGTGLGGSGGGSTGAGYTSVQGQTGGGGSSRFHLGISEVAIDAKHVVHLSLTEGLDQFWPFGQSVLENIFKVFKQKELLEDAILMYRVQRSVDRRVFKIDVGNMPSHLAQAYVERIKNEVHQRRMPTYDNNGVMDARYATMAMNEDYWLPQTAEGRGSSIDILQGNASGQLGDVTDLLYFNNKLMRGLRIPSSYLPTGPDESNATYNDGRLGTALIQEFRFNQYCTRLQSYVIRTLDEEFKLFMKWRGFNIDTGMFSLHFNPPQNFAAMRQAEIDGTRLGTFESMIQHPFMSKRFCLERFLGMSQDEIKKNEKQWEEENDEKLTYAPAGSDLRAVGITNSDFDADTELADTLDSQADIPDEGMDVDAPGGAMGQDMGGGGLDSTMQI